MLRVAEVTHVSDTGRQRKANEDRWFARAPLFGVADGMGGAQAGEVASQIAIDVLEAGLPDGAGAVEERLAALVVEANARVHDRATSDARCAGMGTTMTLAYLDAEELSIAHVGDSRLYRLRGERIERLTRDHSLVEDLVREGRITPEEAEEHPQRSIITRALGAESSVLVDHLTVRAQAQDVYLVCSDGLTSMVVSEERLAELVIGAPGLRQAGRALVDAANAAGGRDNITVVLFRVEDVAAAAAVVAAEEETMVGRGPTSAEVRAALAAQEAEGAVPAPSRAAGRAADPRGDEAGARRMPRAPRAPAPKAAKPTRSRRARALRTAGFATVFGLPVLLAAFIASQSVYFLGTNPDGFVTLYRGLPYDLPAGVSLYQQNFVSGVSTGELSAPVQRTVRGHELRSRADGADLVKQIELGRLEGQAATR